MASNYWDIFIYQNVLGNFGSPTPYTKGLEGGGEGGSLILIPLSLFLEDALLIPNPKSCINIFPLPWVLCLCEYTSWVLTLNFENWDLILNIKWSWLNIFIYPESCVCGPNPSFWEMRFEIEYYMIFALCLVFVLVLIYILGPDPIFWELRFEIEDYIIGTQYFSFALSIVMEYTS